MDLITIFKKFPSQEDCISHLENIRWNGKPTCPYCTYKKGARRENGRLHCNKCNISYSVTVGTIFHQTHLPLQKWFLAISLILNAKKGIASRQLARDLEVTKDTAWRMQMQIRKAMIETPSLMTGFIEMDETYIGGKPRKRNKNKNDDNSDTPQIKRGRGTTKTPIVGVASRDGKVNAQVSHTLTFKDLKKVAKKSIDFENAILLTDDYRGYIPFKNLLPHFTVNHSAGEYARGEIHTNTIEGFWALLKRGITGQYHHLSDKHLNKYIQEFSFKWNNREKANVFENVLINAVTIL